MRISRRNLLQLLGATPAILLPAHGVTETVSEPRAVQPVGAYALQAPYVAQVKEGCGSACIAMITQYWAKNGYTVPSAALDADAIHKRIYSRKAKGSKASAVAAYFTSIGMQTYAISGSLGDLAEHIGKGRPVMVAIRGGSGSQLHYTVVTAISEDYVRVHDPAIKPDYPMSVKSFEDRWAATTNWMLLAIPKG